MSKEHLKYEVTHLGIFKYLCWNTDIDDICHPWKNAFVPKCNRDRRFSVIGYFSRIIEGYGLLEKFLPKIGLNLYLLGRYENSFPIFRYRGTVPGGDVHPVVWTTEEVNVDAVVNGGVFLCMKAGYYHFAAALSPDQGDGNLAINIVHNSRNGVYARYKSTLLKNNLSGLSKIQFSNFFKYEELFIRSRWDNNQAWTLWYGWCEQEIW